MFVASAKSNLGREAGCGLTVSCSDHGWIILGSVPHCKCDVSAVFEKFCEILERRFAWQSNYLVMLEGNLSYSAHCK